MTQSGKKNYRFLGGVLALTLGNIFVKVLGLALKVPLRNLLGDGGMVYYNNAYNVYAAMFSIATAGLPVAVSMLVSECRAKGLRKKTNKIFTASVILFIIIGAVCSSVMLFGADMFEDAYKITDLHWSVIAIAPTMLFICVVSSFRGYFQGYQNMYPTAISEIIEAVGKFALGILLGVWSKSRGDSLPVVAAWATLGISIGVFAGMVYLWIAKLIFNPDKYEKEFADISDTGETEKMSTIIRNLLIIAIPISLSSSVSSIASLIDSMIISRRLQESGFAEEISNTLIGNYSTCASPLYNLTILFIGPITASAVPVLVSKIGHKDNNEIKKIMNGTVLMLAVTILPCAFGMAALSSPIIKLIFGSKTNAEAAAPLLSILCINAYLNAVLSITNTFLHAYKKMRQPLYSIAIAAVVKMATLYVLAGITSINIYASPIATCTGSCVVIACNLIFMKKYIGFTPDILKSTVRPLAASALCAVSAFGVYTLAERFTSYIVAVFVAIIVAVPVYFAAVILMKSFTRDDVLLLPKGEKIANILEKHRLIRN